ncbi:MAG: hypothetical protein ACK57T_06700 [Dolichospermum sp.]
MTAVITPPKVARKDSFFDGGSKSEFIMELVIGNMIESFFLSSFFLVRTYAKYLSLSPHSCSLSPVPCPHRQLLWLRHAGYRQALSDD